MKRLMHLPLLVYVALFCLGAMAGEGWWLYRVRSEATQALAALRQKQQERDGLANQSPALTPENEAAIATELAAAGRSLGVWRAALQGGEPDSLSTPAPATPTDAFFELAGFVRQLRTKASEAQMGLRADESFGFATHAHEGPAAGQIATVHRQRRATGYLVEMLLESRPQALLAVRRERPGAATVRDQRTVAEDYFELEHSLDLRQPGQMEADAFRVEFTGQTATLRHFLNGLGSGRQPVVVRSVEAEPLVADNRAPGSLVKAGSSKFAVALEFVRLADNPAAALP